MYVCTLLAILRAKIRAQAGFFMHAEGVVPVYPIDGYISAPQRVSHRAVHIQIHAEGAETIYKKSLIYVASVLSLGEIKINHRGFATGHKKLQA